MKLNKVLLFLNGNTRVYYPPEYDCFIEAFNVNFKISGERYCNEEVKYFYHDFQTTKTKK